MGTLVPRKKRDGTTGYTAQIAAQEEGRNHSPRGRTFDRKQAAIARLNKREAELSEPAALDRAKVPEKSLANAMDRYIVDSQKDKSLLATVKAMGRIWYATL